MSRQMFFNLVFVLVMFTLALIAMVAWAEFLRKRLKKTIDYQKLWDQWKLEAHLHINYAVVDTTVSEDTLIGMEVMIETAEILEEKYRTGRENRASIFSARQQKPPVHLRKTSRL